MKFVSIAIVAAFLAAVSFNVQAAPAKSQSLRCMGTKEACDKLKGTVSPLDIGGPSDVKKKKNNY